MESSVEAGKAGEYASMFEGMLQPGETIRWTGRPRQGTLRPMNPKSTILPVIGAVFCFLFAIAAFLLANTANYKIIGVILGLVIGILCVYATFNQVGGGFFARKKTYYALTDRRALAVYMHNVPVLVSLDNAAIEAVKLRLISGGRGTLLFGPAVMTFVGIEHVPGGTTLMELRFEDIDNAQAAYDMIKVVPRQKAPEYSGPPVA